MNSGRCSTAGFSDGFWRSVAGNTALHGRSDAGSDVQGFCCFGIRHPVAMAGQLLASELSSFATEVVAVRTFRPAAAGGLCASDTCSVEPILANSRRHVLIFPNL